LANEATSQHATSVPPVDHISHNDLAFGLQQKILHPKDPSTIEGNILLAKLGCLFVLCSMRAGRLILWVI
jgi:hypothetical protein